MEVYKEIKAQSFKRRQDWRRWLERNHQKERAVWLILFRKESQVPSVSYPEAVEEALCFGWIDSKINKRDEQSYYQFFSRRNPKSKWSRVNKERVARLIEQSLMHPSGLAVIEMAKNNGAWEALDEVEDLAIPDDLKALFARNRTAYRHWKDFPRSAQRGILEWILNAKRPETRQKRITETVTLAARNIRANQYQP